MSVGSRIFRVGYCAALAFLLVVPGLSMLAHRLRTGEWPEPSIRFGAAVREEAVPFTRENWFSGLFQRQLTAVFNTTFPLRDHYVRIYNQILYSAFRETHMLAGDLKIGKEDWLFEGRYLDEFFAVRTNMPPAEIERTARRLAALRESLAAKKKFFAVLITPSKASLYPEMAPAYYDRIGRRPARNYDALTNALAAAGVPFVDSHALLADEKNRNLVFARGATHWNEHGAALALNDLLRKASNYFGSPMPTIEISNLQTNRFPVGQDRDLASILNLLARPMDYEVTRFDRRIIGAENAAKPTMALVGISFQWNLLPQAFAGNSKVFDWIAFGYYHTTFYEYRDGFENGQKIARAQWERRYAEADIVALEINEGTMDVDTYWREFLDEAEAKGR